jgi:transcriptional regulator with XRE-family HTH domain
MPKSKSDDVSLRSDHQFPTEFVMRQIQVMVDSHRLNKTQMAHIAGMERSAWHRLTQSGRPPSLATLYRFSYHFNKPMNFWFPDVQGEELPLPPIMMQQQVCDCSHLAPNTQRAISMIAQLSAEKKGQLLKFLESDGRFEVLLELAAILSKYTNETVMRLLDIIRDWVKKSS